MVLGRCNITGAFLRVKREEKFENVEVEYLTHKEMETLFLKRTPEELIRWIEMLGKEVQALEGILNDCCIGKEDA